VCRRFNSVPGHHIETVILKVAKLGVKVLRVRAQDVDPRAVSRGDYEAFLSDLEDTMREYDGTGIAAPQVFTPLRAFLYEVHPEKRKRKEEEVPLTAYFNATYEGVGMKRDVDSEGCLSVPFLWGGVVPRFETIRVHALERSGKPVEFEASGYHARILQHEIDHLDGLVYLDRMPDMKSLGYTVNFG
jgi:peptide deformylase